MKSECVPVFCLKHLYKSCVAYGICPGVYRGFMRLITGQLRIVEKQICLRLLKVIPISQNALQVALNQNLINQIFFFFGLR